MKAKELAELLLTTPDFDVQVRISSKITVDDPLPHYDTFMVDDIAHVGYSSKVILLSTY